MAKKQVSKDWKAKESQPAVIADRALRFGDRVQDAHGHEGLVLGVGSNQCLVLVAFIMPREVTRSEISYVPSDIEIAAMTKDLRAHWTEREEQTKNQCPNPPAETHLIGKLPGEMRRTPHRSKGS